MALQTCKRCRKRRIKCDLHLPACGNCRLSDAECLFYDDSLQQEIPRSYLHALNEQVRELELEIKTIKDRTKTTVDSLQYAPHESQIWDQEYHLTLPRSTPNTFQFAAVYLGQGSSARLMERLLKGLIELRPSQTPHTHKTSASLLLFQPALSSASYVSPSFATVVDHRKMDVSSAIPPSTQRSLIEHFIKVIQPDYPLLSRKQEASLLEHENPLRWSMANAHHPDSQALTAVFAVASALVSRDLEPGLGTASVVFRESLRKLSEQVGLVENSITTTKHMIVTLCFLTICELINPVSGEAWGLLGRALVSMERPRAEYQSASADFDDEFGRLEHSLLLLGCSVAYHFRRPSRIPEMSHPSTKHDFSTAYPREDSLTVYKLLRQIAQGFTLTPIPHHAYFENLIPRHLRVASTDTVIGIQSAMLYVSLHPLFTASPSDIFSESPLDQSSSDLLKVVADSASAILDFYFQQSRGFKLISIWMSIERVLEAGAMWGTYLIVLRRTQTTSGGLSSIGTSRAMGPLQKCSALLASFAERWKEGSTYFEVWETFLSVLWNVLE